MVFFLLFGFIYVRAFIDSTFPIPGLENNQNFAASIVLLSVLMSYLVPSRSSWRIQNVSFFVLILTGSRIAIIAFWFGWLAIGFISKSRKVVVSVIIQLIIVVAAILAYFVFIGERENMLYFPSDFEQPVWYKNKGVLLQKVTNKVVDKNRGSVAYVRVPLDSIQKYGNLILRQATRQSINQRPYTASAYLKSDTPHKVLLSNNIGGRQVCDIGRHWKRCITPSARGDGSMQVQLKIFAIDDLGPLDFYIWGAQLVEGEKPLELRTDDGFPVEWLIYNFGVPDHSFENIVDDLRLRYEIFGKSWNVFLSHPLNGIGWGALEVELQDGKYSFGAVPHHAHNFVLQLLAETGLFGFLGWGIFIIGNIVFLTDEKWWLLIPMYLAVAILNTMDYTFFTNWAFYSFWLSVGLVNSPYYNKDAAVW